MAVFMAVHNIKQAGSGPQAIVCGLQSFLHLGIIPYLSLSNSSSSLFFFYSFGKRANFLHIKAKRGRGEKLESMKKIKCLIQGIMARELGYEGMGCMCQMISSSHSLFGIQGDLGQAQVLPNPMKLSCSLWTK